MRSIKVSDLKNKKVIFAIITLVLFLIFVVGNFYTRDAYASNIYFTNAYIVSDQIFTGDVVEQEFTLREEDQGVSLLLGTYVTTVTDGRVVAELFGPEGDKVAETEVALAGINDNTYVPFYFGDLDESLYNQKLKIRFTFLDIDNQLIAIYASATDTELYNTTVNGEYRAWNITMDGIKKTVYLEYNDFRRFYLFVIGTVATYLAMFKIKWKELNPRAAVERCKASLKNNWKKLLAAIGMVLGSALIGMIAEKILSAESAYENPYRALAIGTGIFVVAFAIAFKKYIWKRVHIFFLVLTMLIGTVYIVSTPVTPLSYDEPIHYTRTTYLSWGATNKISVSDYMMLSMYTQKTYFNIFSKADREAWVEEINTIDRVGEVTGHLEGMGIASVPYMITSIVMYGLRLLRFDFVTRYMLGKMTNLFLYSLCFALGIKMLKGRGKLLLAMIGLMPTNIYMAASYGYDWWVVAVVALGFSLFISELQKHDKISTKRFVQSVGIICVGMLPKAVYFPMLFPMMLLKKERYEESKKCRWITVIGAVALVLSFVLPMFISVDAGAVAGGGDIRGGSDVNAAGQIAYILGNLGEYLKLLFRFMWDYLDPDKAYAYITASAYQGNGRYFTIGLIILALATVLDNSERTVFKKREPLAVFGGFLGIFGAVVLVVTALYVSYTAVGADTVSGCQPRYLLPIIFPFLYFVGENSFYVSDEAKGKTFIWGAVGMALIFLISVYECFIIKY